MAPQTCFPQLQSAAARRGGQRRLIYSTHNQRLSWSDGMSCIWLVMRGVVLTRTVNGCQR